MRFLESLSHAPIYKVKLIGTYCHMESVFVRIGSDFVESDTHAGTFNFFSPVDPAGYIATDIVP